MSRQAPPGYIASKYREQPRSIQAHGAPGIARALSSPTNIARNWFGNAQAARINTDMYMFDSLTRAHPDLEIVDTVVRDADIVEYTSITGDGSAEPVPSLHKYASSGPQSMHQIRYAPPERRTEDSQGQLYADILFDRFLVTWRNHEFLVYIIDGRDGTQPWLNVQQYILTGKDSVNAALELIKTAGTWSNTLHDEIWVYDNYWQKDAELYQAIQKSRWEDIILPESLKEDLLDTVLRFYDSKDQYRRYGVPWKRGLIFHGPPGNGKTVTIKATMKTLYDRKPAVPTLYVKSLVSYAGPEYSIKEIFSKARQQAPCYLVFEDLDSLVTDDVRSYFLNAVDGLSENDGLLLVGSTNHLERLDPGLAKRPSRFDRKYLFDNPNQVQREAYCEFWQKKILKTHAVEFPDLLVNPIASLMDGFSFASMQEAFVSTLLKIIHDSDGKDLHGAVAKPAKPQKSRVESTGDDDDDATWDVVDMAKEVEHIRRPAKSSSKDKNDEAGLMKYKLWREIKEQIHNLRKDLGGDDE